MDSLNYKGVFIRMRVSGEVPDNAKWIQTYISTGNRPEDNMLHVDSDPTRAPYPFYPFKEALGRNFRDQPERTESNIVWRAEAPLVVPLTSGGYSAVVTVAWGCTIHGTHGEDISPILPTLVQPSDYQLGTIRKAR